jgi:hypothetical protein
MPEVAVWSGHLCRLITTEVRTARSLGLLTTAEAEQLLARLVLVIDQAVSPVEP